MPQPLLKRSAVKPSSEQTDLELSRLLELVRFRAAQLLGGTEVIELHARQLLDLGETIGRMGLVYWWAESSVFTSRERMAFALCEALVLADHIEVAEPLLSMARQDLSEEEMLGIVIAISAVIDWNQLKRWEITGNQSVPA